MDLFQQRHGGGSARRTIGRAQVEGNRQLKNKTSTSNYINRPPLEGHWVGSEPPRSSSKRASAMSIKTLIHEEMARERKVSQSSPSVIAKLMGLDSLPPSQAVDKQQKEPSYSLSKTTHTSYENCSLGMNTNEHQEFKDVYEIEDSMKVEKGKLQPAFKRDLHPYKGDTDVAFVRQKFMEAKRLSTDETLQSSKEFGDAIEVLDSNKDLFLKFLDEPDSLFTKNLHDVKGFSPALHEDHITLLRPLKSKQDSAHCKSEVMSGNCAQMQKDSISTSRKSNTNLFNHLLKEHSGSLSHKLLKSRNAGKNRSSARSTRIVVLKPNLEKAQDMVRNVSESINSHENNLSGYIRHNEYQHSGIQELHAEERERQNLFVNLEVMGQRVKGSREIAREVTKQMKRSVSSGSERMLDSGFNRHIKGGSSFDPKNSGTCQRRDNFDEWSRASSASTSSSIESSVKREARKRLSAQWRMTNQKEARYNGGGPSTLAEMLAIPDKRGPRDVLDSYGVQKVSDYELARGMLGSQFCSTGISSKRCSKDKLSTNLPRSSSLPASSSRSAPKSSRQQVTDGDNCYMLKDVLNLGVVDYSHGNLNQRRISRKSSKFRSYKIRSNSAGEENKLPIREIRVDKKELKNVIQISDPSAVTLMSKLSDDTTADTSTLDGGSSFTESIDAERPFITSEEHVQQPVHMGESSCTNRIHEIVEETSPDYLQESSPDHPQVDSTQCGGAECELTSSVDAKQPSPVSVLEHQLEEGESSPECFEKINTHLQGLRMQLQLLRLESDTYNTECESTGECNSPPQNGQMLQIYENEEDRDYSYLLDIVTNLGLDSLANTCCFLKHPEDLDVFENLEEKYGVIVEWSKSERKLLFDVVSLILEDTLSPWTDEEPWLNPKRKFGPVWDHERLVEKVWQMVIRLRNDSSAGKSEESILDPRWLDFRYELDTIGKEIEGMLKDDLLEELISEFILG
ncbi:uncharacterized protein A4U43_C08F34560 [Asparagus officinalis]|uniref:uncharacterized protein LOC109819977 n=1 Tax=Asparagus officinalis TaxID=4686 RepID=UPI00098E39F1|nr:uncharacterized protein LOC109819977 [Asparagus officinalis]ONK61883.1 uncharacterized protein A4U43_C08F34560 [Asparagus officinalis]